ncbi:MAG: hypothetical protein H0V70_09000 [Ktedonobacteraceae bacterium]|nr:hypothetical protein [Ktedonobacteraceae bacterium]
MIRYACVAASVREGHSDPSGPCIVGFLPPRVADRAHAPTMPAREVLG